MINLPVSPDSSALPIWTPAALSLFHPILSPLLSEPKVALLLAAIGTLSAVGAHVRSKECCRFRIQVVP